MKQLLFITAWWLIVTCIILLTACEDNPARSDNGDHANAVGFALEIDGHELVRYFAREFTFNAEGEFNEYVQGDSALYFHPGNLDTETMLTESIRVVWLDQNEDPIGLPEYSESGNEWELRFEILEPGSRSVPLNEADRPYTVVYNKEQESWYFQLEALQSGRGDLRVKLWHIDHADVLPVPLPVYITVD